MALVDCPECGRGGVSDSAVFCPGCGYGIKEHFDNIRQEEERKRQLQQTENVKKQAEIDKKRVKKNMLKMFQS